MHVWMHTQTPAVSLFLSHTHTQAEILYAFKSGLSILCMCVCVYPSGNSCPDGISSFREACNQLILRCSSLRPGRGSEKRGEENEKAGGRAVRAL